VPKFSTQTVVPLKSTPFLAVTLCFGQFTLQLTKIYGVIPEESDLRGRFLYCVSTKNTSQNDITLRALTAVTKRKKMWDLETRVTGSRSGEDISQASAADMSGVKANTFEG
jgi:hypothetical protein